MTPTSESIETTLGLHQKPGRSRLKYLIIGTIVIAIAVAGAWYWFKHRTNDAVLYTSAPVEIKTLISSVSATGNLEPTNTVDVGIEVSGTINEVLVDYNSQVKVGQIMARLDTTKLASNVASSQASLSKYNANAAEIKATLVNAQNEWERVHKMYQATNGNYPSKKDMDDAYTAVEKAKAQLNAASAQIAQASAELKANENDMRKAIVVSPINGIVLQRKVEPGQTVAATMTTPVLFTMAEDLTKMKAIVSVDEADIGEVKEGQKALFSVDAYPNKKFNGTITQLRLNSETVNGVVTYDAVVEVDNSSLLLRPGMTVSAQIITGTLENALTVPNAALRFSPPSEEKKETKKAQTKTDVNKRTVWVLKNNKPVKIDVTTGTTDGTSTVIIGSSLTPKDSVLVGTKEP
ncbi:MAG: efflux RND transporter periplasmic adaptor subunit [Sulfuricurvum sp.]|uniref:efflux RND transporter periplasmic adaptor subunit n=1 Tax=Sulfuricurvum sp. TaxID=2025608 RepID=UPI003D134B2D